MPQDPGHFRILVGEHLRVRQHEAVRPLQFQQVMQEPPEVVKRHRLGFRRMQHLARIRLELRRKRVDDLRLPAEVVMQVTRTDIDFVSDLVDRGSRHPVFVEQQQTGHKNPMPGIAGHGQLALLDTLSATHSA